MVRHVVKAQDQDIRRTIQKEKKRFIAIMIITVLGVMMFSGLKAGCVDLRRSADRFFDRYHLHDLMIQSTLGLTDDDVTALQAINDIEKVEGIYNEEVQVKLPGFTMRAALETLSTSDIDLPYVTEGRMPHEDHEVLATEKFLYDTGLSVGDTFTIEEDLEEDEEPTFALTEYTITGSAIDVRDINNPFGSISFRSTAGTDIVFVTKDAVNSDVYTAVELTIKGNDSIFCFSNEYDDIVRQLETIVDEEVREQREKARTEEVLQMAEEKIAEAEAEVNQELMDAKQKLDDSAKQIEDALQQLKDGQKELNDNRASALKQMDDAQKVINDNQKQLDDAKKQLDEAAVTIAEGKKQLEEGQKELDEQKASVRKQIAEGRQELNSRMAEAQDGLNTVNDAIAQLKNGMGQLMLEWPESEWNAYVNAYQNAYTDALRNDLTQEPVLDSSAAATERAALVSACDSLQNRVALLKRVINLVANGNMDMIKRILGNIEGIEEIIAMLEDIDATNEQLDQLSEGIGSIPLMAEGYAQANGALTVMKEQLALLNEQEQTAEAAFADAQKTIDDNRRELEQGEKDYQDGLKQYQDGLAKLMDGQKELDRQRADALKQMDDAQEEINDGMSEVLDGQSKLEDGRREYEEGKAEARERFADAREKLKELDTASWYVQNRKSLSGYSNLISDAGSIEAIGTVFPIVFLIVAILMSLTTITRMVEEERGLIGTYKSLGYTDAEILKKYFVYSGLACASGALIGTFLAFVGLPLFLFWVFGIMYRLPQYYISFVWSYGLIGPVIFLGGILLAAWLACRSALKQTPAILMRPKSPKEGSRVILEYITPLWKRMSFLNKVTARNLFRYKKRMIMTITGIAGCMALLLFGFAIKDSVTDLAPRQYEETFDYDLMAAGLPGIYDDLYEKASSDARTKDQLGIMLSQVTLTWQEEEQTVQLMVFPDDADYPAYLGLETLNNETAEIEKGSVLITRNAADILRFGEGDAVKIQLPDLQRAEIPVAHLVKNYLGNYIYMNQSTYEMFFEDFALNGLLLHINENCPDHSVFAADLKNMKGVTTALSTQELTDQFEGAFTLINFVVYVVITMSALLAFVVLFTLSTTNVSEREREIATIKVLGFFDPEVHAYIDKETMILTFIGLLAGIPLGYAFAQTLTAILNLPSIHLAVSLHTISYFMAAGLVIIFALAVQFFTDRSLNAVDPVSALKSVE